MRTQCQRLCAEGLEAGSPEAREGGDPRHGRTGQSLSETEGQDTGDVHPPPSPHQALQSQTDRTSTGVGPARALCTSLPQPSPSAVERPCPPALSSRRGLQEKEWTCPSMQPPRDVGTVLPHLLCLLCLSPPQLLGAQWAMTDHPPGPEDEPATQPSSYKGRPLFSRNFGIQAVFSIYFQIGVCFPAVGGEGEPLPGSPHLCCLSCWALLKPGVSGDGRLPGAHPPPLPRHPHPG